MYIFRNTKKKHFTNYGSAANSVSIFLQNTGAKISFFEKTDNVFTTSARTSVFKILISLARKRLQVLHSNKKDIKPCEKDGEPFCWTPCTTICHSFENDPGPWKSFFSGKKCSLSLQ